MENLNKENNEGFAENEVNTEESEFAYKKVLGVKSNTRLYSVISICLSILSVILFFLPIGGIICGVLGILFAIFSRKNLGYFDNISLWGLIIGIFGTVFSVMGLIFVYALSDTEFYKSFMKAVNGKMPFNM